MTLEEHLHNILVEQKLTPLFQPIVDFSQRRILGYEALIRGPSDSPLHAPVSLFDAATRSGRLAELDLACRRAILEHYAVLGLPGQLFINVNPEAVDTSDYRRGLTSRFLDRLGVSPDRIVIELTEHQPIEHYDMMRHAIEHYRSMGFTIAIDDLGAGYSSLRHWSELRPDFVKIDRHFIEGVDIDPIKREFVRSILDIAEGVGTRVIAEGIESLEEYRCLWSMGITYGQGYYFARPVAMPRHQLDELLPTAQPGTEPDTAGFRETAAGLARKLPTLSPDTATEQVARLFQKNTDWVAIALVDPATRPLGLVRRDRLQAIYASDYGRALYGRTPISQVASESVLCLPVRTPLDQLSHRITGDTVAENSISEDNQIFLLTDDSGYFAGAGFLLDLLRAMTELKIQHARHANPLTQLPGNVPINRYIDGLLAEPDRPFTVIYADLDNFKPYNDEYGYARGDDVLMRTAQVLRKHKRHAGDFIGHVGGDDFILVLADEQWQTQCEAILSDFESLAAWFYNAADRKAGGHYAHDRQGQPYFVPLLSLSMAALPINGTHRFGSHQEIAGIMASLKHRAKQMPGNSLFVERRGEPGASLASDQNSLAS